MWTIAVSSKQRSIPRIPVTDTRLVHANLPKELQEWLGEREKHKEYDPQLGRVVEISRIARDIATTRVWLGPNNSFYAQDKTGHTWGNLPKSLLSSIESSLKYGIQVKNLTLGYGSSYFITFQSDVCRMLKTT
jgi:hypothetical protein